jgi:hypothetical protein
MTTITQADRDAAADCYLALTGEPNSPRDYAEAQAHRDGHYDAHASVQAFARHRLAAEARAIIPLVQQAERADKWQDIETAPYNTPVIVEVGSGMSFAAQLVPDASINSEDQSCAQWRAVHQGEHPPCWSDGACWQRNENEVMSMQPRRWRALDPEEIVK